MISVSSASVSLAAKASPTVLTDAELVTVAAVSVPYVRESPGPTVDVLGTREGEPVVTVEGRRTFPTDGSLRLTTVLVTQPERAFNLLGALSGWFARDTAVLPYEAIYPDDTTAEDEQAESAAQMVNSQDTAVAAALAELSATAMPLIRIPT